MSRRVKLHEQIELVCRFWYFLSRPVDLIGLPAIITFQSRLGFINFALKMWSFLCHECHSVSITDFIPHMWQTVSCESKGTIPTTIRSITLHSSFTSMAVQTGSLKATVVTPDSAPTSRASDPPPLRPNCRHGYTQWGGGFYRWRCGDYDDDDYGGGGVTCHSLSLGLVLSYQAHHPPLMTSATYPGEARVRWEKHATGIGRTRSTACVLPRARLCLADMSVLFFLLIF